MSGQFHKQVVKLFAAFSVADGVCRREAAEIIEWARSEMANFKVPRRVEFIDALPVNATGKVVKDELRGRI